MHILHVTPYYTPAYAFGGVTRSVEGMTRALARRGHRVTVLTTDAFDQSSRYSGASDEMLDAVHVLRACNISPLLRGRLNLSTPYNLRELARTILPDTDIVHCHEFRTVENWLITPLVVNRSLVLSPHGTLSLHTGRGGFKSLWDRLLSPAIARRFESVIGLTQAEADEAREMWGGFEPQSNTKQRIHTTEFSVIPNGIDPAEYANLVGGNEFRQRYGLGDAPVCLFMGRLHERKGIGVLVQAFKAADVAGARLVVVGPDEGMLATIQTMLDERMIVTGYLSGAERLAAFASADLLALPAVGEGLPMVVLEAMAAGLPVIVSPGCNLPEVKQYGAGLEVEAAVESLADALRMLLNDPSRRTAMGMAARELVQAQFTWDRVAERLESVYLGLLDTH